MTSTTKNAARRNGKAWKKKPGVAAKAATGRTESGYSPATAMARAAKRALRDPALRTKESD